MKTIIPIFFVLLLSCKTQEKNLTDAEGTQLPPIHIEASEEASKINSILQSSEINSNTKLFVNGKEYPVYKIQSILDTIPSKHAMDIKVDTLFKEKQVFIKY